MLLKLALQTYEKIYICNRKAVALIHSHFSGVVKLAIFNHPKALTLVKAFAISKLSTSKKQDSTASRPSGMSGSRLFSSRLQDCIKMENARIIRALKAMLCYDITFFRLDAMRSAYVNTIIIATIVNHVKSDSPAPLAPCASSTGGRMRLKFILSTRYDSWSLLRNQSLSIS